MLKGVLSIPDKGFTLQGVLANKPGGEVPYANQDVPANPLQCHLKAARDLLLEINKYSCAGTVQGPHHVPPLILALMQNNPWARDLVECSKPFSTFFYMARGGVGRGAPLAINTYINK